MPISTVGWGQLDFHHRDSLVSITAQFNSDTKNKVKLVGKEGSHSPPASACTLCSTKQGDRAHLTSSTPRACFTCKGLETVSNVFLLVTGSGRSLPAELTQQSRVPPAPSPSQPRCSQHKQCSHCFLYFSIYTNHAPHNFRRQSTPTTTGLCRAAVVPRPVPNSWRQRSCRCGKWGDAHGTKM